MVETLKEIYLANKAANMLIEALDQADLQAITKIIAKLRDLKKFGLPSLNAGIEKAIKELNAFTGGGSVSNPSVWAKLKTKVGVDNPVVKAIAFASALENGVSQLPALVKNAVDITGDPEAFGGKTLTQILTTAGGDGGEGVPADGAKKLKALSNIMIKALRPAGRLNSIAFPYVTKNDLIKDLINTKLSDLDTFHKTVKDGLAAANKIAASGKVDAMANPDGGVPEKGSAQPTKGSTSGGVGGPGDTPPGEQSRTAAPVTATTPAGQQPASATHPAAPGEVTGGESGVAPATKRGTNKPATSSGKAKFPDYATALKAAGITNLDDPKYAQIKAGFEKFYKYIVDNTTV